jgi:hypothetical protein
MIVALLCFLWYWGLPDQRISFKNSNLDILGISISINKSEGQKDLTKKCYNPNIMLAEITLRIYTTSFTIL